MSANVQFQTRLTYKQVAELVRQLPASDKRRLAKLLEKENAIQHPELLDESNLTPFSARPLPTSDRVLKN